MEWSLKLWLLSNTWVSILTVTCLRAMQIYEKYKSAFRYLYNISNIRKFLYREVTDCLIHAFVTSKIDYGNNQLYDVGAWHTDKLQWVQNMTARLVGGKKHDHIKPILFDIHWLPEAERIKFKLLLYCSWHLRGSMVWHLLTSHICLYQNRILAASNKTLILSCMCPVPNVWQLATMPLVYWNSLPAALRGIQSLDTFKHELKKYSRSILTVCELHYFVVNRNF